MLPWTVLLAMTALLGVAGCAAHSIPQDPGPVTEPRASWIVRAGPLDQRRPVMCRSDAPGPCVIALTTGNRPTLASVSIYLFAADGPTTYKGVFFCAFIGDAGWEREIDEEIAPNAVSAAHAVFGTVVEAPGSYEFRLSLTADVPGHSEQHKFELAVPVRLVPAPSR